MRELEAYNEARASAMPQVDWLIKWNPRATNVAVLVETKTTDGATLWTAE
jgi:hypothetical protein